MKPPDSGGRSAPVSNSTPESAGRVFPSDRLALAERYAELLRTEGVVRGLIGPRETHRLWERHLLNCVVLGELLPVDATVCDVGSGAGLPGIVLAIARPDLRVTLLEPKLGRTTFLEEVVAELGLGGVEVVRGRADDLHGLRTFDAVTSRAVAPLDRLLAWSMPLVAATGELVALKGSTVQDEIEAARATIAALACAAPVVCTLGAGKLESTSTAIRVAWADPTAVGWRLPARPSSGSRRRRTR